MTGPAFLTVKPKSPNARIAYISHGWYRWASLRSQTFPPQHGHLLAAVCSWSFGCRHKETLRIILCAWRNLQNNILTQFVLLCEGREQSPRDFLSVQDKCLTYCQQREKIKAIEMLFQDSIFPWKTSSFHCLTSARKDHSSHYGVAACRTYVHYFPITWALATVYFWARKKKYSETSFFCCVLFCLGLLFGWVFLIQLPWSSNAMTEMPRIVTPNTSQWPSSNMAEEPGHQTGKIPFATLQGVSSERR